MVPAFSLRQTAAPLHISTARANPPSALKSRYVFGSIRAISGTEAQVFGHRRRVDLLAGVHQTKWVPDALELAHRLVELRAEDQLIELGALQTVAVLAGHDTAETVRQTGGGIRHVRHGLDALDRLEVDQGADVETAGGGVRVVGGGGPVRGHELFDGPDVLGKVLDRNGDVLDHRDRLVVAADAHQESQTGLAHRPDILLSRRIEHDDRIGGGANAAGTRWDLRPLGLLLQLRSVSP